MTYQQLAIFMLRDAPEAHDACCKLSVLIRGCSILIIEPDNFRPSVLGNVRRQETCAVCDAPIRLAVLTFVL